MHCKLLRCAASSWNTGKSWHCVLGDVAYASVYAGMGPTSMLCTTRTEVDATVHVLPMLLEQLSRSQISNCQG